MGILRFGLVAFLLVLLIKKKLDLGVALIIAAVCLGLMYTLDVFGLVVTMAKAVGNLLTVEIIAAVMLIIFLSELMKRAGQIKIMVSSLRSMLGDPRGVVVVVPALIGFFPIIGGAMISAPMVEDASDELKLTSSEKTFLNYWFRHIWEYIFPTYPGIILSTAIVGISLGEVALTNLPLTVAAVVFGLIFGFRRIEHKRDGKGRVTKKLLSAFFISTLPLAVVLIAVLIFKTDLALTLALVFLAGVLIYRVDPKEAWGIARDNFSLAFVSIVVGVLAFKGVLEDTGAVGQIAGDLASIGIPTFLALILLPFIIGASTGMTSAYVGITFPILLSFFTTGSHPLVAFMLAYAAGYAGVMLSPVHMCLVLTTEYFKADLGEVYKKIIAPELALLLFALGIYLVFEYIV